METITCELCSDVGEYVDDGKTLSCMPDGVLIDSGTGWVCSDCMVDDNGETLPQFS